MNMYTKSAHLFKSTKTEEKNKPTKILKDLERPYTLYTHIYARILCKNARNLNFKCEPMEALFNRPKSVYALRMEREN